MIDGLKAYPSYKDSGVPWLSQVPEHWIVLRGKWLFCRKKQINEDGAVINVLSLTLRGVVNNDINNPEGLVPKDYATYQLFRKNDLVFKLIDLENIRTSRVGLVHENGIMSSAYVRLSPKKASNNRFFYQQYYDLYQRGIYNQLGAGVRSTLGPNDLLNLRILIPSDEEQYRIVQFIDHANRNIQRYIRAKQKLINLLEEQKQAIIHKAVTHGLDPKVRLKSSNTSWLDGIPEHWELVPLKSICFIQSGVTLGKNYFGESLKEYPYLRVANVQAGRMDLRVIKTIRLPEIEAQRSILRPGDVLMTEGGDPDKLGRGCVWEGQVSGCLHQNHIFAVRPNLQKLLPHFLAALLVSEYAKIYFLRTAKQTTNLASTNKTTIGQFRIPLPSKVEQEEILNKLNIELHPVNDAIEHSKQDIDLIREYRTCLISNVVTGKLDVRYAAALLPDEVEEPDVLAETEEEIEVVG